MAQRATSDTGMLAELEPVVESLLERHLEMAKPWYPHEYVPYSRGRDYGAWFPDAEPWTPDHSGLDGVARTAFMVNLLTEDNLPSYHRVAYDLAGGRDGAWINWVHRWTAEEARHSIVMRDYLVVTRSIDPRALEDHRMEVMGTGYTPGDETLLDGLIYTAVQELATRISHRNTGRFSADPVADRIMARVAADENLHMVFYRDVVAAAAHIDASAVVESALRQARGFRMPGTEIPGFRSRAVRIAAAGIYDVRVHRDEVLLPLLRHWGIFDLQGLSPRAEQSRQALAHLLDDLEARAERFEERRGRLLERGVA